MANARNLSTLAQGASTAGVLAGGYGGTSLSSVGSAGNVLFTTDGTAWSSTAKIVRGTSVATTSGTSIDFTALPSWVKRITVMLNGVSLSGTSTVIIQIGSTTFTTSGYVGAVTAIGNAVGTTAISVTTGFGTTANASAADARIGSVVITNITGNTWVSSSSMGLSNIAYGGGGGGVVSLSGTLDRVRLTSVNGTDTFDAGSVNILYE